MIKNTALALCAMVAAVALGSCCTTGEPRPPKLRRLPEFQPVPAAPEVHYGK